MLTKLGKRARQLRRRFSRSHLLSRWLGYEGNPQESHEPGLIILQMDGLSRQQFEAALAKRRLPFLKKLMRLGYYERVSFYSGLPSTTPAVQGEIMYGVKGAVPAFQFLHRKSGQVFRMFEMEAAQTIAQERFSDTDPLLKDGASYANIYSGGASEARLCAETTNLPTALKRLNLLRMLMIFFLYFFTLVRIAWLACVELIVGIGDMIRGLVTRGEWWPEIEFIPRRILVSIVLREWIRIVVKLSIDQGKPVIHANLLGYDEQAHRRGPSAAFAHWGLKGMDKVIEDIFRTAKRSDSRDYEVLVFSDHGQEETQIYEFHAGYTIQEAVKNALKSCSLGQHHVQQLDYKSNAQNLGDQMPRLMRKRSLNDVKKLTQAELAENVVVTAMGPLGYIYFPVQMSDDVKAECAKHLVNHEKVPLAIYRTEGDRLVARNRRGLWKLPEDIEVIAGSSHPFLSEIQEDLIALCNHPDAGEIVISGWDPERPPVSFVSEHGAHAGMGSQETRGFALIPKRMRIKPRKTLSGEAYIRGLDFHHAAKAFLSGDEKTIPPLKQPILSGPRSQPARSSSPTSEIRLRVVTYNTHHCVGLDGKCRPRRIAEILADLDPDLVALQEMDVNRHRSGNQDQAHFLASQLGMHHHFFPVWCGYGEQYGLAVLSRFPLTVLREEWLTEACHRTRREARGAVWVSLETESQQRVHLLNTHLGLYADERLRQVEELLGPRWLANLETREPVIIAGDLNSGPTSRLVQKLKGRFHCVQTVAENHQPKRTFPTLLPLRQIDYILTSQHFRVESVEVPRNHFTLVASDHLPLSADLTLAAELFPDDNSARATREGSTNEVRFADASSKT